jgi:ATP-dependent helicase/nuclease subunit B
LPRSDGAGRGPGLFTIAPGRPFADDLAAGILAEVQGPLDLARTLLLLPNRRSIRALIDAFIRQTDGAATVLPRMVPVADVDTEDLAPAELLDAAVARPVLSPAVRRLELAALLSAKRAPAEALALATELGRALDTLTLEGRSAADVAAIEPGEGLRQHWAKNHALLEVVTRHWPGLLEQRGLADPVGARVLAIEHLAEQWRRAPPAHRIVAAGIVHAPPAVADLIAAAVRHANGVLILPGFDSAMEPAARAAIIGDDDAPALHTHPQAAMLGLLGRMGIAADEIAPWPHQAPCAATCDPARARLVGHAMAPPRMAGELAIAARAAGAEASAGLAMVECEGTAEEALVIAIALRQAVEHPGTTAALVTPDRQLARRVAVQLGRFGIDIDDSAGEPLSAVPAGSLMLALAEAAAERFAPVPLLALLKHPLVRAGDSRLGWLDQVRALDRLVLRGPRPGAGLAGTGRRIAQRLASARQPRSTASAADADALDGVERWWREEVRPLLDPLEMAPGTTAEAWLDHLVDVAQQLAGAALHNGKGGRELSRLFDDLAEGRSALARMQVDGRHGPALLRQLLEQCPVRPPWQRHPQLTIWGPLEARLQRADLMILGGMNEGNWPAPATADPFLPPVVRRLLGLPPLDQRIGLMAHDFLMACGAPAVLLTRAAREGSAPSVPSRFWQRLAAVTGPLDSLPVGPLPAPAALLAAARALDRPASPQPPFRRPAPAPPPADRPRSLSVTEVSTLKTDPFLVYARRMLRLRPLDPVDADPTAGDRGSIVHAILEEIVRAGPGADPATVISRHLAPHDDRPELLALWRPRIERMVAHVVDAIAADPVFRPFQAEVPASIAIDGIRLSGRADRIDTGPEGYRIVDYKTGIVPPVSDVRERLDMQMGLLALLLREGAFEQVPGGPVAALEYWKLSGGREAMSVRQALGADGDIAAYVAGVEAELRQIIADYLHGTKPFIACLHLPYAHKGADFDGLARVAEWL